VGGEVFFQGKDLLKLSEKEMMKIRGDEISMVFQDPMTSLNPVHRVGKQIGEMFIIHKPQLKKEERRDQVVRLLEEVAIPSPGKRIHDYPHQLSGGMRQRAMMAMALACWNTKLLIADEPTTALDVTTQAQVLDLLKSLQERIGMSVVLITHDLGVVAEIADRVMVMYAGSIVETADVETLFRNPLHPYTRALLASLPQRARTARKTRLYSIPGLVPSPLELRPGCKFFNRCPYAIEEVCLGKEPDLLESGPGHQVRCVRVGEISREDRKKEPP
jgi:oligopeptide/dipeptide ABC transporter ATP-binding protein